MESKLANDTVYGTFADSEVALAEFLSDDFSAGFWIEKSVANDLTDEFLSTPIVGFRSSFGTEERLTALFKEESSELEVPLTTKAEFGRSAVNAVGATFALNKHGQFQGDFIIIGNGKGAEFALDTFLEKFDGSHRDLLM